MRWYHLGEGEYEATELAIREALEDAEVSSDWPPLLEPLRAERRAGRRVIPPTPELFPGGVPSDPGGRAPSSRGSSSTYEAGGAFLAAGGEGEVALTVDGEERDPVVIDHPGLHALVVGERHRRHRIELRAGPRGRGLLAAVRPGAAGLTAVPTPLHSDRKARIRVP